MLAEDAPLLDEAESANVTKQRPVHAFRHGIEHFGLIVNVLRDAMLGYHFRFGCEAADQNNFVVTNIAFAQVRNRLHAVAAVSNHNYLPQPRMCPSQKEFR
ncbi:MAG TPA: hypothetical protein DDZ51_24155 [Planctomycetaceae bacterium]|nr:hypothetical protein [Planctomycetaceae bacterium]